MAKQAPSADVVTGRKTTLTGKTDDEVHPQAAVDAKTDHRMLEIPSDVVAKVKAAIRDR